MTERAALVTGASAGIGLAVSTMLAESGYGVTMVARDRQRLDAVVPEGALGVAADAADAEAMSAALAQHLQRWGRLDVVVANAGTGSLGTVASTEARHLERLLRTNVGALFTLARLAMPALRDAGAEHRSAWFVVTASISGVQPAPGFAAYSASKAAAVSVARSVDAEESAHGVRACALCPAFVETAMTEWTRDSVPGERMLRPEDVAEAVRFLLRLSPNASVTEIVLGRTGVQGLTP